MSQDTDSLPAPSVGEAASPGWLKHAWLRIVLAIWILSVVFLLALQEGFYKFTGKGAVGQHLRSLNAWVGRFTTPKTTFEPER